MPYNYTFSLCIPFHLIQYWCNTCTNLNHQMIWSISYHHVTLLVYRSWPHLLFTVAFVHRRQVLLKLPHHAVYRFKASDLPFTLATGPSSQALSWSSPPSHMTLCHVSYAISSIITCVSLATFPSHFHLYGMHCWHKCTCGLISCVSYIKHTLVHLGCHSITKTKLGLSVGHE